MHKFLYPPLRNNVAPLLTNYNRPMLRCCIGLFLHYIPLPRLLTGVATISRALRKQRRAQRMSSSFLSRPQFWSGADPPPPQFCAKEVAASTCPTNRRKAVRKMLPDSSGEWVRSIARLSS